MTATKPLDMPLPFVLKQEKEENMSENDSEDDNEKTDSDSTCSLAQPSILDRDSLNNEPRHDFLRLTSMVRRVYFSYLHKSILNNYNACCKTTEVREVSRLDLKKFASQMELQAVRASLEASLYRQAMLKMISEVKSSTVREKVHKKLSVFLQTPPSTVNVAVQTCEDLISPETKVFARIDEKKPCEIPKIEGQGELLDKRLTQMFSPRGKRPGKPPKHPEYKCQKDENIVKTEPIDNIEQERINPYDRDDIDSIDRILNATIEEDHTSQDSIMQHLEDMFCESDDSSDLTTLIERHSGVPKPNLDKEIKQMSSETDSPTKNLSVAMAVDTPLSLSQESSSSGTKRKLTLSSYKNKKRVLEGLLEETKETKKMRGIWFVERIHQVSKLKAKLMELSSKNYRKHGKIRTKFNELFGDDDGDDLAPDSPIRIEDHLTSCKERIAPWVVKYLMPFYSKRVIKDRLLFKAVAKHIADMLIIDNTFPEEEYVNHYIADYFRNKPKIKTEADIYM